MKVKVTGMHTPVLIIILSASVVACRDTPIPPATDIADNSLFHPSYRLWFRLVTRLCIKATPMADHKS